MSKRQLIVHENAKSPIAEIFRTLRTNLHFSKVNGELKMLMFTSVGPGEGKSTTASNLAVALAQSNKKVILLDCDLRKPVQHKIFEQQQRGLTNVLVEKVELAEVIQATEIPNLWLLASGPIPPNPSELLQSQAMQDLLEKLKTEIDFVIVDAPPVIAVTDACILAEKMDGVVLVVNAQMTRPEMALQAKELLLNSRAQILGVVLNQAEIATEHSYYYYYYGHEKHSKCDLVHQGA